MTLFEMAQQLVRYEAKLILDHAPDRDQLIRDEAKRLAEEMLKDDEK